MRKNQNINACMEFYMFKNVTNAFFWDSFSQLIYFGMASF